MALGTTGSTLISLASFSPTSSDRFSSGGFTVVLGTSVVIILLESSGSLTTSVSEAIGSSLFKTLL